MEQTANVASSDSNTASDSTPETSVTSVVQDEQPELESGEPIQTLTSPVPNSYEGTEEEMTNEPTSSLEFERTTTPTTPTASPLKHLSQRDSSWLEIDVCREFLRGDCSRNAEECIYAHPTGSVVIKDGNKVTCCFDFLKDRCTRETCKYLHPSNKVKEKLVMAGKQYGQVMALSSSNKPLIAAPLSPAMQPLPVGGAFPIPYSYVGPPLSPSNSLPNASTPYSLPYYSHQLRMEVCDAHEQGYDCGRGDHCFFSHPEPYVRVNSDNTVTVCWNFLNGYCHRPNNCWFYHPTPIQLMAYQFPTNRLIHHQQPTLDSVFLNPYSHAAESKVTSYQPQLSPSMISPYPSFMLSPPIIPTVSSSVVPPSPAVTQFSTSLQQQTIVS